MYTPVARAIEERSIVDLTAEVSVISMQNVFTMCSFRLGYTTLRWQSSQSRVGYSRWRTPSPAGFELPQLVF